MDASQVPRAHIELMETQRMDKTIRVSLARVDGLPDNGCLRVITTLRGLGFTLRGSRVFPDPPSMALQYAPLQCDSATEEAMLREAERLLSQKYGSFETRH